MKSTLLAVLAALAPLSAAQDQPPNGAVEGTVVNTATGAGISGASVTLHGDRTTRSEGASDAAGHFRITGIPPGDYFVTANKDGFAPFAPGLRSLLTRGLHVSSSSDAIKVEVKLTPFDSIQGRVLGPDAKPLVAVEVGLDPDIIATNAVTDVEGRFTLTGLRPGSYTLIAKPPKSLQPEQATGGTRTAMVTTYYPSAVDPSLAQQIVLRGLGDHNDLEIRMQTGLVHRVSGIVLDEKGKPSPDAELALIPIPETTPEPMGLSGRAGGLSLFAMGLRPRPNGMVDTSILPDKNGHFEFPAVRSGNWRIIAGPMGEANFQGSAEAFVGRGDVDDVQIRLARPFKLTAAITRNNEALGGQNTSDSRPMVGEVFLINPDINEFVLGGLIQSGQMLFENVMPGQYKTLIRPGLSAQIFLGENEAGQTFPVSADGPPMHLVLKTWAGTVRGTVEKGDGATVVLIPQRIEGVALGQTVICGAGGSFELNEVSPGYYYIAAFDHMDELSPSAAMLSLVPSRGSSVKVEEHSSIDVTLSVIPAPR
jgi:hypothetical protein